MSDPTPKYPDIKAVLTGTGGNIFMVIARVSRALRRAGIDQSEVSAFAEEVMDAKTYDQALGTVYKWVKVS